MAQPIEYITVWDGRGPLPGASGEGWQQRQSFTQRAQLLIETPDGVSSKAFLHHLRKSERKRHVVRHPKKAGTSGE